VRLGFQRSVTAGALSIPFVIAMSARERGSEMPLVLRLSMVFFPSTEKRMPSPPEKQAAYYNKSPHAGNKQHSCDHHRQHFAPVN
jgi:hypothetical protein